MNLLDAAVRLITQVASPALTAAGVHLLTDEQLDDMLAGEKVDGILLGMWRREVAELDEDLARGPVRPPAAVGASGSARGRRELPNGWTMHTVSSGA